MADRRPLVVIPGRLSASASALRYGAVVVARALAEAVYASGGEPVVVLPDGRAGERFGWADAVLMPGGGDLAPSTYGEQLLSDTVYDVDALQDSFDLAVTKWALGAGLPLLAVCRGLQVVNVAFGGSLNQHVEPPHRSVVHSVRIEPTSRLAAAVGVEELTASCYHHQTVARLGAGLVPVAHSARGDVEAVERPESPGFFLGVQWHPEDTAGTDPVQARLFAAVVEAAAAARAGIEG